MYKLSIKNKLLILVILPTFCFLVSGLFNTKLKYDSFNDLNYSYSIVLFAEELNSIIHELQLEIGLSTISLVSKNNNLLLQRKIVNKKIKDFLTYDTKHMDTMEIRNKLSIINKIIKQLKKVRLQIDNKTIDKFKIISFYSSLNNSFLNLITILSSKFNNTFIRRNYVSFEQLIRAKEAISLERAIISYISKTEYIDNKSHKVINHLIYSQKIYIENFYNYASKDISIVLKNYSLDKNFIKIEKIHNNLLTSSKRRFFLKQIVKLTGYGGLIHDFKNFLLRKDSKYEISFMSNYNKFKVYINSYKELDISSTELLLINKIEFVFDKYFNNLKIIKLNNKYKNNPNNIDKIVEINDKDAIESINKLSHYILLDSRDDLFSLMSYKINKINNLNTYIIDKIKDEIYFSKINLRNNIYYFLSFVFIILLIILLIERIISKDIYKSFEEIFFNINNLFKYINKEVTDVKVLKNKINYNSEINSKLAILNKKFSKSKHLLEKENNTLLKAISISTLYRDALENSSIIIRINLDRNITFVNSLFCELSGYSKEELIGIPYSILQKSSFKKEDFDKIISIVEKEGIWKGSFSNVSKTNKLFYTITTIVPLKNITGNTYEYIGIRQDITKLINLHDEIENRQRTIIYKMGEIAETRSKETGNHVKRVAYYSKELASLYGMSKKESDLLFTASPMHDIGKVGIPDSILNKPGKLTKEEFEIIKSHSKKGFDILKGSNEAILEAAAIVSFEHHEKWDGSGYPRGLKGKEIHIYGRITAIADVFDALGSKRVYKEAWKDEDIFTLFTHQKGKQFDPILINLFLSNKDIFINIRNRYIDII